MSRPSRQDRRWGSGWSLGKLRLRSFVDQQQPRMEAREVLAATPTMTRLLLSFGQRSGDRRYSIHIGCQNMKRANDHDVRIASMTFASVYPHYLAKIEKKGRSKEELHQVIKWLTGYNEKSLQKQIKDKVTFEQFFQKAKLNPNAQLITGVICGHRVEEIENPLTQKVRYLDKLVDELAKGRKMEKILRAE